MASHFLSNYFFDSSLLPHFRCDRFRDVVKAAAEATGALCGCLLTTITPLGCEIFDDPSYLNRRLTRFYIYIFSDKQSVDASQIEQVFLRELLRICEKLDPPFAASVAITAARSGAHNLRRPRTHQWDNDDRLIVAEYRSGSVDPLADYASYLLACIDAINAGTIPEAERFSVRRMARTRLFQIGLILERGLARPSVGVDLFLDETRRYMFSHRSHPAFYFDPEIIERPTADELRVGEELFVQLKTLSKLVKASDDIIDLRVKAFHGDNILSFSIDREKYKFS